MGYSREIDGLRALSVVLVIIFHVQKDWLPGGFIGVDVFFVISGFLITSLIYKEINANNNFSFAGFYLRRFARLLPALVITLSITLLLGFLLYGPKQFDSLGKDTFFAALGIKNILDAGGANYFVKDVVYKPLLHMWSLGVEEQFYLVWPATLLIICTALKKHVISILSGLLIISLIVSEYGAISGDTASYFMPQYRAFELLAGAFIAVYSLDRKNLPNLPPRLRSTLVTVSLATILGVAVLFDEAMTFPGINTLLIVIPAIVLILYSEGTLVGKVLANKTVVTIGLISYPLYLYHQPIISFTALWDEDINPIFQLLIVSVLGTILSYLTYKFAETPIRRGVKAGSGKAVITGLVVATLAVSGLGLWIAKNQGFPNRLAAMNPYAYSIANAIDASFYDDFKRGIHRAEAQPAKILFIGDSQLQQYVKPLSEYWGYSFDEVDVVSRGGCVLLKTADYDDSFADISCDELREYVYENSAKYDKIVLSQAWHSYIGEIKNLPVSSKEAPYSPEQWQQLLEPTAKHLADFSDEVVIIGPHPAALSTCGRLITPITSASAIKSCLETSKMDYDDVRQSDMAFKTAMDGIDARILLLGDIWCNANDRSCSVGNSEGVPFFRDRHHFGRSADKFLVERLNDINF